jgi:hypothetical protein
MKESYREEIASSSGLKPYADIGNDMGVASERGDAGQPLSSDIIQPVCRSCHDMEKATSSAPYNGKVQQDTAESKTLSMCRNSKRENREILLVSTAKEGAVSLTAERSENVPDGTSDMNANRKSDEFVVPTTSANKGATEVPAESTEERDSAKKNTKQAALPRTSSRIKRKSRRTARCA